jgi:hypothetical protein
MSVAVLISYLDSSRSETYLPLATEKVFAEHWLPAAAALGCVWIPTFQTGASIPLEELPTIRAEFEQLRDHFTRTPGASEHVRERSRWIVEELSRINPAAIREVFIG